MLVVVDIASGKLHIYESSYIEWISAVQVTKSQLVWIFSLSSLIKNASTNNIYTP